MRLPTFAVAAVLSAGLFAGAAVAQDQPPAGGGEHHGNGCMAGVMQSLGLSGDQKTQLKAIRESSQTPEEKRAARDKVLTPAQQQQFQAARDKCRAEHGGH